MEMKTMVSCMILSKKETLASTKTSFNSSFCDANRSTHQLYVKAGEINATCEADSKNRTAYVYKVHTDIGGISNEAGDICCLAIKIHLVKLLHLHILCICFLRPAADA
ncbi:hypothetical protein WN944_000644 [Citrus x changshan-huyou]|uniref:Uncharacterized protein n=1 Tax=Citrus x changshan-huyou TaxID=2935761 RepID=A0AAP0MDA3_9ROSI